MHVNRQFYGPARQAGASSECHIMSEVRGGHVGLKFWRSDQISNVLHHVPLRVEAKVQSRHLVAPLDTLFGIKQYNTIELKDKTWHEVVPYRQDISDIRSMLSNQEVWIGVSIGNYDKGGHKVSLNVTIHPEEEITKKPTTVLPLFNTNNVMEMAGQEYGTMFNSDKGLEVAFTVEKDMKNVQLRYITTGHGGWENGDEFVPKKNTILLNGAAVFALAPWRQDCGSYRLFNPASGNFPNGLSSSDYSRANWCPGMVTNPFYIDLGDLKVGSYTLQVKIPQGATEGNSFSAWNVSGILIGE